MSFDLLAQQQQILARLATLASPVPIVDHFDLVDLTDDSIYPAGAQTHYMRLAVQDQVGRSAMWGAMWSFDIYVDTGRVSQAQKDAAYALFSAALAALIGWEVSPAQEVHASAGHDSVREGRLVRTSFGFTIPVYLAG